MTPVIFAGWRHSRAVEGAFSDSSVGSRIRAMCFLQDIAEDQQLLARLVHNISAADGDADAQYEMLAAAQVCFCGCSGVGVPCWLPVEAWHCQSALRRPDAKLAHDVPSPLILPCSLSLPAATLPVGRPSAHAAHAAAAGLLRAANRAPGGGGGAGGQPAAGEAAPEQPGRVAGSAWCWAGSSGTARWSNNCQAQPSPHPRYCPCFRLCCTAGGHCQVVSVPAPDRHSPGQRPRRRAGAAALPHLCPQRIG